MNNAAFGKVRKHRYIKVLTTDKRRKQLALEPNYHKTNYFSENLMAIEMKNTKVKVNKPVYLGMSILDISKRLMYGFWYDYIKLRYQDKAKLWYIDTGSIVIHNKTEDFYKNIANGVEKWFYTFNFDQDDKTPLPIGENKINGLFKDKQEEKL